MDTSKLIPKNEQQSTYEVTDKYFSPLTGAKDVKPILRMNIDLYPTNFAFLLYNVLSPSECKYYIQKGEELGLQSVSFEYRQDYRNNDRCIVKGTEVAELIFSRVKEFMEDIDLSSKQDLRVSCPPHLKGIWTPYGLNEVFRLCKYHPGGHFAPHFDGNFVKSPNERSMKTFMIYLNDDFEGGSTNFIDEGQKRQKIDGIFRAEEKNILQRIKPVAGMAMVFNHHLYHEGEQLKKGVKYIMRSDIMYKQESPETRIPKETEAARLIQEAERLEGENRSMEAAELYRRAFKLWPQLEETYNNS